MIEIVCHNVTQIVITKTKNFPNPNDCPPFASRAIILKFKNSDGSDGSFEIPVYGNTSDDLIVQDLDKEEKS